METHTRNQSIGDEIAINAQEGDNFIVSTEKEADIDVTVIECPTDVPVDEYHTSEVICEPNDADAGDTDIIALYAHVMDMGEMHIDYDLYALRITEVSDTEDLGEITELKSE